MSENRELSTRLEPKPDQPYGKCRQCNIPIQTKEDAAQHMRETAGQADNSRSHTILMLNPTREERVDLVVGQIIEDAITKAIEELSELTYSRSVNARPDATEDEITEALKLYSDGFSEEWQDYLKETHEEDDNE